MTEESNKNCIMCDRSSDEVPLIQVEFMKQTFMVCSQHLPVLIHDPSQLIGRLPGAENIHPADHHD
jgi:hypothetical protein